MLLGAFSKFSVNYCELSLPHFLVGAALLCLARVMDGDGHVPCGRAGPGVSVLVTKILIMKSNRGKLERK